MKLIKLILVGISIFILATLLFSRTTNVTPNAIAALQSLSAVNLWKEQAAGGAHGTGVVTQEYTNKVELADIDRDGLVDLLFANGGNYNSPGVPECSRIFKNLGDRKFEEVTDKIFGRGGGKRQCHDKYLARAIRVADFNGDGFVDIFVATTYATQSQLYLGTGGGAFINVTKTMLPQELRSFGDATVGDVNGDGYLDLALADWGSDPSLDPMANNGGLTRLWLNRGRSTGGWDGFEDVTNDHMPQDALVRFSWDLDFVDVDNDFDLDLMVSSKLSESGFLFENNGQGYFANVTQRLPQWTNNYDFEAMDVNKDGFLDVMTINDGEWLTGGDENNADPYARRDLIFLNDRHGGFVDATSTGLSNPNNPAVDDNIAIFLDYDSDGDPDILIGALETQERLLINDGFGRFTLDENWLNSFVLAPETTTSHGTLGMAVSDLDFDGRLDVVDAQGEVPNYFDERLYFGLNIPRDTAPPIIALVETSTVGGTVYVRARVHDNKSPTMPQDWVAVTLRWQNGSRGRGGNTNALVWRILMASEL